MPPMPEIIEVELPAHHIVPCREHCTLSQELPTFLSKLQCGIMTGSVLAFVPILCYAVSYKGHWDLPWPAVFAFLWLPLLGVCTIPCCNWRSSNERPLYVM